MPLVCIKEELYKAQQGHYALPLFDTFDMYSTDAMFTNLEEKRAPMMIALYAAFMDRPNARAHAAYIRARAEVSDVPVSLMLDHGASFEQCMKALRFGFTDVMYDGSKLPMDENIATTKLVVRAAHEVGVAVEAEIGHVGRGDDYESMETRQEGYTNPEDAVMFVEETGVDFLAVAVGTVHGIARKEPQLDFELLKEIRSRVEVPLVLHGGSGVTEDQFREAIQLGITKINVATDLYVTTGRRLIEAAQQEGANYHTLTAKASESLIERTGYYLDLFGATGKG